MAVTELSTSLPTHTAWKYRLRPTLMVAIVTLVMLTALVIGGSAAVIVQHSTESLIDHARSAAVAAATDEVGQFFDDAPRITGELAAAARLGALPLDKPALLGPLLASLLRSRPHLAWIGYADAESGRFVGVTRQPGNEIIEYVADPQVAGGVPEQWAVTPDGKRTRPTKLETAPYLVLEKDWYKKGIAADGPNWSEFYKFTADGIGITCTTRFTANGAEKTTGLFDVDLRVHDIAKALSELEVGDHGAVFLVDSVGKRLVSPAGAHVAAASAAVDAAASHRSDKSGAPVSVNVGGHSYEVNFAPVEVTGFPGLAIAVVVDRYDITDAIYETVEVAAAIAAAAALLAILLGVVLSTRIARPITAIASDLATIGAFQISRTPAPQSLIREISDLGTAVNRMKASLRSFGHYVPVDVVRALLSSGREAQLGGEIRRLTMHFSDIENFTTIAEGMTPEELVAATGRYFELMTGAIAGHGGTLDKFVGDGIVAFYNAPLDLPNHTREACLAALDCQQALVDLQREQPSAPVFRTRIGIALGDVLVGNIGTSERFAYTMLGDDVNLASRLEGLNKPYGTYIMATQRVVDAAGAGFEWRQLDRVAVKGRQEGTLVYELLGRSGGAVADGILEARTEYEMALDLYFEGKFAEAASRFDEAARLWATDKAAPMMAARSRELAAHPPAAWIGIHVMHEK